MNTALPSGIGKLPSSQRRGPPYWNASPLDRRFWIPSYVGIAFAISARIAAASLKAVRCVACGITHCARLMKISHSVRASRIRRPGISGEKYTRRSVEVSVPPPACSYRVLAGSRRTVSAGSTSIEDVRTRSW